MFLKWRAQGTPGIAPDGVWMLLQTLVLLLMLPLVGGFFIALGKLGLVKL